MRPKRDLHAVKPGYRQAICNSAVIRTRAGHGVSKAGRGERGRRSSENGLKVAWSEDDLSSWEGGHLPMRYVKTKNLHLASLAFVRSQRKRQRSCRSLPSFPAETQVAEESVAAVSAIRAQRVQYTLVAPGHGSRAGGRLGTSCLASDHDQAFLT